MRVQPEVFVVEDDVVCMALEFAIWVSADVHISWVDPNEVWRMVVGSGKLVGSNDFSLEARRHV